VVARNAWFVPALVDKAKLMIASNDWEGAMDTVGRILQNDTSNVDAMLIEVLNMLVREGRVQHAVKRMLEVKEVVERDEPKTHRIYYNMAQIFSRVSGTAPFTPHPNSFFIPHSLQMLFDSIETFA
jgi:tetratricopeptide repeat protein 21B